MESNFRSLMKKWSNCISGKVWFRPTYCSLLLMLFKEILCFLHQAPVYIDLSWPVYLDWANGSWALLLYHEHNFENLWQWKFFFAMRKGKSDHSSLHFILCGLLIVRIGQHCVILNKWSSVVLKNFHATISGFCLECSRMPLPWSSFAKVYPLQNWSTAPLPPSPTLPSGLQHNKPGFKNVLQK